MWLVFAILLGLGWLYLGICARRTTLVEVWIWLGIAMALGMTLLWVPGAGDAGATPWRWCVATCASCPFMALLGAKRPQHHAWQFVVGALWIVLSLPAWEALVYGAGQPTIDPLRAVVCWLLMGMAGMNWLGTRFWLAAICGVLGQAWLYLPFLAPVRGDGWPLDAVHSAMVSWGIGLVLAGVQIARMRRSRALALNRLDGYTRVWRNWRDCYGLIWGFRLLERMHDAGKSSDWPADLAWSGFLPRDGAAGGDYGEMETALRGLLRRFVDETFLTPRHAHDRGADVERFP